MNALTAVPFRFMKSPARWRIGDVAKAANVTVRTLRHYERLGLLPRATRSAGDQRVYDASAVKRLVRIRALRELGLSLDAIRKVLRSDVTVRETLRAQLDSVDAELERLKKLRTLLAHAAEHAKRVDDTGELLSALEARAYLQRHVDSRPHSPVPVEEWNAIRDELRACQRAGLAADAARVKKIAGRALQRLSEFAGGDVKALEALSQLRVLDPPKDFGGWDAELFRYLERALARHSSRGSA
ncbi:MAG: MerR family transcriptional regulator [Archangium sp.]